jgi:hypothetical protein
MSVLGVIIGTINDKIKKLNKNNKEFKNTTKTDILTESKISNHDKIKFKINSMFYDFCFSNETAKIFLENHQLSKYIRNGFILSKIKDDPFLEKILKDFLKKKYGFDLGESSFSTYRHNGYEFYIDISRYKVEDTNSYFEILYNNFEDVKDENGFPMGIAKEFIVYFERYTPKALFILVFDPIINSKVIRRLYENGQSTRLIFVDDDDETDGFYFLKEYVRENKF